LVRREKGAVNEEETLVRSFVIPAKRERMAQLLASSKMRGKATSTLAHFKDLEPRWVVSLSAEEQDPASVERALRSHGAPDTCHVISEDAALDGKRLPLRMALGLIIGSGMGTLLSCVPGTLAFFEDEEASDRCILAKRAI
jgi:hypothetical protein